MENMDESKPIAHLLDIKVRTDDVRLSTTAPFSKMILSNALRKGLQQAGFVQPTVVQAAAIPIGKAGIDLLVQSKSGTGKTLIFCSIILENYRSNITEPQSLIIAPTREIAVQTAEVIQTLGRCVNGFRAVCVIGGLDVAEDRKRLQEAKCIVGTPGRVLHLINNKVLNISQISILVLDEVDKLYNNSFRKDLQQLQEALTARTQTIACSATFCDNLDKELAKIMLKPVLVSTEKGTAMTGLLGIKQFVYELHDPTHNLNVSIFEMLAKRDALNYIFRTIEFKQCIVFSRSQLRADSYFNYLKKDGWPCEYISGGQKQKTRLELFRKFRDFKFRILLTTDLMARGIDSEHVNLVINLELPQDMATYLHRIGRAGRFGSHGIAISLLATDNDKPLFNKLLKEMASDVRIMNFPQPNAPNASNDAKDKRLNKKIDFWDFSCPDKEAEYYGLYSGYKEDQEQEKAPLNSPVVSLSASNTIATTATTTISTTTEQSSIDTKTFQIDSKDSAINGPVVIQINDDDAVSQQEQQQQAQQQLTQSNSQNGSSQYLVSSNTIDDASSIAVDSLRTSNQSMTLQKSIKSKLLQVLIDRDDDRVDNTDDNVNNSNASATEAMENQQRDQDKKQESKQKVSALIDHFDKYIKEVLNDSNDYSTTTQSESPTTTDDPSLSSQGLTKLKLLLIDKSTEDDKDKKAATALSSTLSATSPKPIIDLYDNFIEYMGFEKEGQAEEPYENNNNNNNNNDENHDDDGTDADDDDDHDNDYDDLFKHYFDHDYDPYCGYDDYYAHDNDYDDEEGDDEDGGDEDDDDNDDDDNDDDDNDDDDDDDDYDDDNNNDNHINVADSADKSPTTEIDGNTFVLSVTTPSIEPQESLSRVIGETNRTNGTIMTTTAASSFASTSKLSDAKHYPSPVQGNSKETAKTVNLQQTKNLSISKIAQIEIAPCEILSEDSEYVVNLVNEESSSVQTWSNDDSQNDTNSSGFDEAMVSNGNLMDRNDDRVAQMVQSNFHVSINRDIWSDDYDDDVDSVISFTNEVFMQNMNGLDNVSNVNNNMPPAPMIEANHFGYERWINLYWDQINLVRDYVRIYTHVQQQQRQ